MIELADRAAALAMTRVPCSIVVGPLRLLAPASVKVPAPRFTTAPEPLSTPEYVEAFPRLKTRVPLLVRLPVPPRRTPVVPPTPIWSVPPALRLIVP